MYLASCNGGERARTADLLLAKQALSQLSYTPLSTFSTQLPAFGLFLMPIADN